jgi:hypothetical protein
MKIVMPVVSAASFLLGGVWLLQAADVGRLPPWPDSKGFLAMAESGWTALAAVVLAILGALGTIGGIALVLYVGTPFRIDLGGGERIATGASLA